MSHEITHAGSALSTLKYWNEDLCVQELLRGLQLNGDARAAISARAETYVLAARVHPEGRPLLDSFLQEFGLSNEEGIALMCLAEALLRIPDAATADALIAEKVGEGDWAEHMGQSDSLFVNASAWGLLLTGHVISFQGGGNWLKSATGRLGEPVIRQAMTMVMRSLGGEFVLGRTIEEAMSRGEKELEEDLFSFDMLGEGARTFDDAEKYFNAYEQALMAIGENGRGNTPADRSGISIKLSALHPRYEVSQWGDTKPELLERTRRLAQLAKEANIGLTIDAEEADRLDISLDLFEELARDPDLVGWEGLGLAVQAYGKRALAVIDWIVALASETKRQIPVRLVKGAYWDTEIKLAQIAGNEDYPVFTRKQSTDLSYLVCAERMRAAGEALYCQFATHNAFTVSAVLMLFDRSDNYEFQRLHGMGTLLYRVVKEQAAHKPPVRVYAPVGSHRDLLAYLVRRLLENGANTSFVHGFLDDETDPGHLVGDPVLSLQSFDTLRHYRIPLPVDLFGSERLNARGLDIHDQQNLNALESSSVSILSPSSAREAGDQDIAQAFDAAAGAQPSWNKSGGAARGDVLERVADLFERDMLPLCGVLVREAGKTFDDAVSEVREAVDFCRYYGAQARGEFQKPQILLGPTGERNEYSLTGRGVFVCISPWNFPLAIFTGQVVAALAAGNSVLAKPAEQTPLVAGMATKLMYEAGLPRDVLHLLNGEGASVGAGLVKLPDIAGVAFTGSTETAWAIQSALAAKRGPIVPFIAETGGQNAMFVDSTALLEQVSDDVIQSGFRSAGQRCSALRVLYLQRDTADDAIQMITGAMQALKVGNPALRQTDVGPVIDQAAQTSLLDHLQHWQEQILFQCPLPDNPGDGFFVPPTLIEIKRIDQLEGEHFGPIVHVIRYDADNLDRELEALNAVGYGLTLGVHSRIESHARHICEAGPAGNSYINRNMVGAVVGVQPFGGQGLSGSGPKAGGPHYLHRFAAERVISINTMASGGNTALLNLD